MDSTPSCGQKAADEARLSAKIIANTAKRGAADARVTRHTL